MTGVFNECTFIKGQMKDIIEVPTLKEAKNLDKIDYNTLCQDSINKEINNIRMTFLI